MDENDTTDLSAAPPTAGTTGAGAPVDGPAGELFAEDKDVFVERKSKEGAWTGEESLISWRLIAVLSIALLVVAGVVWRVTSSSKQPDAPAAKPVDAGSGSKGTTGPTAPANTAFDITDAFATDNPSTLGQASGRPWEAVAGTWGTKGGHAFVQPDATKQKRSIAVIDLKATNGSVQATLPKVTGGWGLVFRYTGPYNYWVVTTAPKYGALNLLHISDGKSQTVATATAKYGDGTIVRVDFQNEKVAIVLDGVVAKTVNAPDGDPGTKVGMFADLGTTDPTWERFAATHEVSITTEPTKSFPKPKNPGTTAPAGATTTTAK